MIENLEGSELLEMAQAMASVANSGVRKDRQITEQQQQFAAAYVLCAGNAEKAATLAGYKNPAVQGQRTKINPKVAALIETLSLVDLRATIPRMIDVLLKIATDPAAPPSERRKAANDLLDRAGVGRDKGPGVQVAVQVNNAGPMSEVIGAVWKARDARLSGIDAPMPDSRRPSILRRGVWRIPDDPEGEGGGADEGSPAS